MNFLSTTKQKAIIDTQIKRGKCYFHYYDEVNVYEAFIY